MARRRTYTLHAVRSIMATQPASQPVHSTMAKATMDRCQCISLSAVVVTKRRPETLTVAI